MSTVKEQFKSDLKKDPEDLEREADGAREDLEGTVDELMQRFSPSELLNRGISMIKNQGNYDFIRNLSRQVENNPIPTVMVGVGLIWLISASKQPSSHQGAQGSLGESLTDTIGKKAGATRDKLSSAASSLTSSTNGAADRTREAGHRMAAGASNAMHRVSEASRHTVESARSGLRSAREGYTHMLSEQPLLVGVLAVAAGATLGALLSRTPTEDRLMGEMSDRGFDAIKDSVEEKLHAPESPNGGGSPVQTGASRSDPKPPNMDPASQ